MVVVGRGICVRVRGVVYGWCERRVESNTNNNGSNTSNLPHTIYRTHARTQEKAMGDEVGKE